ncbi:MAG: hypothetical protein UY18_C0002G0016 [Microgenomates group bacterium GW2011_GWF2_47_9]|nr:MAG: hypothetical protein UY18_C0002G0016 [Microgenomates group bacterium GW2011_GWF2_47_9]
MQTLPYVSVETLPSRVLVLSADSPLTDCVTSKLTALGLEVEQHLLTDFLAPNRPSISVDYDYVLGFFSDDFLRGQHKPSELQSALAGLVGKAKIIFCSHISNKSRLENYEPYDSLCLYGDYLGDNGVGEGIVKKFIKSALTRQELELPGDGLSEYHLLALADLCEGIVKLVHTSPPPKEIYLYNPSPISLLSLAYKIRSHLPFKIDIVFNESLAWNDYLPQNSDGLKSQSMIGWEPQENLELILTNHLESARIVPASPKVVAEAETLATVKPQTVSEISTKSPRHHLRSLTDIAKSISSPELEFVPQRSPRKPFRFARPHLVLAPKLRKKLSHPLARIFGRGIGIAFLLYLFSFATFATILILSTKNLVNSADTGREIPPQSLKITQFAADFMQANLTAITSLPGLNKNQSLVELDSLFSAYKLALNSLSTLSVLSSSGKEVVSYVLSDGEGDIAALIEDIKLQNAKLYQDIALLDGSLPTLPPSIIPTSYEDDYLSLKSTLADVKRGSLTAKTLLTVLPDLIGLGSRRKYIVLFQNNMELRPTGGFIGSLSLLSFENGKLYDMPIYDVYDVDGQLKGHVEPPRVIKNVLGEANWYLRDSNWDPDFPTSARRAEWFLKKSLSQDVHGTIGINLDTLKDILKAMGPVRLADYNEEVSAENIFERAEYHAEINFFPGSTQKKEFLGNIADSLVESLRTLSGRSALDLAKALSKSIDEKNLTIASNTSKTDRVLSSLGWNGEIRTLPCPAIGQGDCLSDYAMLVDSNLGINKSNFFLKRKISLNIDIDAKRLIKHSLFTTYFNTSTSAAWPAGAYKNYSRLYLPPGTIFRGLKINGNPVDETEIALTSEHDRLVVGFLVEVPINSTVTTEVNYELTSPLPSNSPTYSLYWQKQPGTSADPLDITLNIPLFLEPELISPKASVSPQQLKFNLANITDRRITIKFR